MTVEEAARPAPAARTAPRADRRRRARPLPPLVLAAAAAFTLASVLRLLNIGRGADLFVDELIYRDVGRSTSGGGFPRTDAGLFFLHPPGFFYLETAWGKVFGAPAAIVPGIYDIRIMNALLGGLTAALLVVLVTRAASLRAGVLAGVLFAVEPYCIRQNDRVMLETATMVWVLAGYLVLLSLAGRPPPGRVRGRAVGAGLLFGLALLTKDHATFITLLPLFLAVVLRWGPPRLLLLLCAGTAVVPYAVYVCAVAAAGHFAEFWTAKTSGVGRLLGFIQVTGFNAPGAPSLTDRLTQQTSTYVTTYSLLALAPFVLFVLLRRRDPMQRFLALFHGCACLTLMYALLFGTLEEQALYLLVVPNLLALAVALSPLLDGVRGAVVLRTGAVIFVTAVLAFSGVAYGTQRFTSDDGYARLRAYLARNVPAGTSITAADGGRTEGVSHWALMDRYRVGTWVTPRERSRANVRYLVVPWKVIDQGYGAVQSPAAHRLAGQGTLVFSFHGRTYGDLALYRLPDPRPGAPLPHPGTGNVP